MGVLGFQHKLMTSSALLSGNQLVSSPEMLWPFCACCMLCAAAKSTVLKMSFALQQNGPERPLSNLKSGLETATWELYQNVEHQIPTNHNHFSDKKNTQNVVVPGFFPKFKWPQVVSPGCFFWFGIAQVGTNSRIDRFVYSPASTVSARRIRSTEPSHLNKYLGSTLVSNKQCNMVVLSKNGGMSQCRISWLENYYIQKKPNADQPLDFLNFPANPCTWQRSPRKGFLCFPSVSHTPSPEGSADRGFPL